MLKEKRYYLYGESKITRIETIKVNNKSIEDLGIYMENPR